MAAVDTSAELHVRLRATAEARHAALGESRPERSARAYADDTMLRAWTLDVFRMHSRGLDNVRIPLVIVGVVALVWTPLVIYIFDSTDPTPAAALDPNRTRRSMTENFDFTDNWDHVDDVDVIRLAQQGTTSTGPAASDLCSTLSNAEKAFNLLLTALSFMLVFRLNRSATRHYEARQLCGWIMIHSRDIAMTSIAAHSSSAGVLSLETRDRLCEVSVAFPVAFMLHMFGSPATRADAFEKMCDGIFMDASTTAMLRTANHRPLALIEYAQAVLARQFLPTSDVGNQPAKATLYEQLMRSVRGLGVPLGGCERIQGTPLPYAYVVHLRSFLLLVICGVPIVHACAWRWATVPLSLVVAFALLGLEAASVECERPFSPSPTKNNHDVENFCGILSREVSEMLVRAAALKPSRQEETP